MSIGNIQIDLLFPVCYTIGMKATNKILLNVTGDMHAALRRRAAMQGATISGLVRVILAEWLLAHGETGEYLVEWGSNKRPTPDDPPADSA